jgi:hypothetical protein
MNPPFALIPYRPLSASRGGERIELDYAAARELTRSAA